MARCYLPCQWISAPLRVPKRTRVIHCPLLYSFGFTAPFLPWSPRDCLNVSVISTRIALGLHKRSACTSLMQIGQTNKHFAALDLRRRPRPIRALLFMSVQSSSVVERIFTFRDEKGGRNKPHWPFCDDKVAGHHQWFYGRLSPVFFLSLLGLGLV